MPLMCEHQFRHLPFFLLMSEDVADIHLRMPEVYKDMEAGNHNDCRPPDDFKGTDLFG